MNSTTEILNSDAVCLVIKAKLKPVGDTDRFQPAGFPEVGHVIYDAPRQDGTKQKVCIVDSPASMANHLETVCMAGPTDTSLHADLNGLPYAVVVTERASIANGEVVVESPERNVVVTTTLSEGHRIASDYFVGEKDRPTVDGGELDGQYFRGVLKQRFGVIDVPKKKGSSAYFAPSSWWDIYRTIFNFDPNSLVHGVMFAKEQIKISRLLTAHHEAFGANRVGRSGVKFDQLGKTLSGQPIFSVDEETAEEIRATFIMDLGLLRSYGRDEYGLNTAQKQLLLDLSLWKVRHLLARPFRYRTQCFLRCTEITVETENCVLERCPADSDSQQERLHEAGSADANLEPTGRSTIPTLLQTIDIGASIAACGFGNNQPTRIYFPAQKLFKAGAGSDQSAEAGDGDEEGPSEDE